MQAMEVPPKRSSIGTKTSGPVEDRKGTIPAYPLLRYADLQEVTQQDIIDIVIESTERYGSDPEATAKAIKDKIDKSYNPNWHCIVGESFAFDVSYDPSSLLHIYNGPLAVLLWKCD